MSTPETARLAADVVALTEYGGTMQVLLIRRGWDPYAGLWALPGGHIDAGETAEAAARRELHEETGINPGHLTPTGVYSAPGRDPRGRYVTFAFATTFARPVPPTAGDDAVATEWVPLRVAFARGFAFDHAQIVTDAVDLLYTEAEHSHADHPRHYPR
ncbi:NUDIX hydrolase [Frankia sp. Cr1]|uniref:NUDIX hydrolase n=1 Tax=Frankia sp. Cr1 TaxID=3073931 RepID=UPI002AD50E48|nr:NUDIX hydrolase [Frankia sp. Cr1]